MPLLNRFPFRTISFVIPTHNEERHLQSCLASILEQRNDFSEDVSLSILVVDNASIDSTVKIANNLGVKVLNVEPGNPGRSRNAGAAASDAEVIAFVDADCVLPAGWLCHGLSKLSETNVVAVGSTQALAPPDASWVERCWVETIVPQRSETWESVRWLPAFNLILRKRDFDAVGGFDESLKTCEDSDLSFRLSERGRLLRDARYPVYHLCESKTLSEFFRREMWRSRGNLRSALKREALTQELASLFLPIAYALLQVVALTNLVIAVFLGGEWWMLVVVCFIVAIVMPIGIALIKRKSVAHIGPAAILFAAYLLARGIGPFWPAARVAR